MLGYHGQYEHHTSGSQWSDPHQKCLQISCNHEMHHHGQKGGPALKSTTQGKKTNRRGSTASRVIKELAKWIKI